MGKPAKIFAHCYAQSATARRSLASLQSGCFGRPGLKDTVNITFTSMDNAVLPTQIVTVISENTGATLQVFDLFHQMRGGRMRVNAVIDGLETRGTMHVDDYRLVNIPFP